MNIISVMIFNFSISDFGHPRFLKSQFGHPVNMKILAKSLLVSLQNIIHSILAYLYITDILPDIFLSKYDNKKIWFVCPNETQMPCWAEHMNCGGVQLREILK